MANHVPGDQPRQLDLNPTLALERLDSWLDGAVRLLPNIVTAILVALLFWGLASLAARLIGRWAARRERDNLGEVLGGFVKWGVLLLGILMAATIVVPTLKAGDLIAGLGVSSVAIGFAFKDILQNWLAGLLILMRQPFEIGDQIEVSGFQGTVERIESRATIIRTYDGQRVVIPNSDIYTNAVLVKTAYDTRRSQYDVGIGYGDDIEKARTAILDALADITDIETDPAPEVLAWDLAASWITLRVRWWTDVRRANIVHVRAAVITAIRDALDREHIDMPFETQVHLFHDQTEAHDGDRDAQREGWPSPGDGAPEPRWKAQARARARAGEASEEQALAVSGARAAGG